MLKRTIAVLVHLYRFTGILRYVKSRGFKLQKWQTRYILTGDKSMLGILNDCRATYKTFSVIARAFLLNPSTAEELVTILRDDPDFCRIHLKQFLNGIIINMLNSVMNSINLVTGLNQFIGWIL